MNKESKGYFIFLIKYNDFFDRVHLDESWFYIDRKKRKLYLALDEFEPHCFVPNKDHIEKIHFLVAFARPRYDPNRNRWFDGKIGLWPFAEQIPAQRKSKNRPAGALVWTSYNITRTSFSNMLIEKVLPAIKQKWPRGNGGGKIRIQMDNATSHQRSTEIKDAKIKAKIDELGLDCSFYFQPSRSPELNILDLGLFNSLKHSLLKTFTKNKTEMVDALYKAYNNMEKETIDDIFITLMMVMNQIIEHQGYNNFKIKYINKKRLRAQRKLPVTIKYNGGVNQFMEPFMVDEESKEEDDETTQEEENDSNDSNNESDESTSCEEDDSDDSNYSVESDIGDT